jgi:hypothetical protein
MGKCIYCGKPAGFFSIKHPECEEKRNLGWSEILKVATEAVNDSRPMEVLLPKLEELAKSYFFRPEHIPIALSQVWENIAEDIIDNGTLDNYSERRLLYLKNKFGLSEADIDNRGVYSSVCKHKLKIWGSEILELAIEAVHDYSLMEVLQIKIKELKSSYFIKPEHIRGALIKVWEDIVYHLLYDAILNDNTERNLLSIKDIFDLTEEELDSGGAYLRVCEHKINLVKSKMLELASEAVEDILPMEILSSEIEELGSSIFIKPEDIRDVLIQVWEDTVNDLLDEGTLDDNMEKKLLVLKSSFNLTVDDLDSNEAYSRVVKSGVLRDIMNGKFPERLIIDEPLSFNFQKNEKLIWAFDDVSLLEDSNKIKYVGKSSGVSIKIAKGIYYRTGGFKGQPISKTERIYIDNGIMAITNKHIYFTGRKGFRIPFSKIISFIPYSDGIGIIKDSVRGNQQVFMTGDGWFIYNLCVNVSQMY